MIGGRLQRSQTSSYTGWEVAYINDPALQLEVVCDSRVNDDATCNLDEAEEEVREGSGKTQGL